MTINHIHNQNHNHRSIAYFRLYDARDALDGGRGPAYLMMLLSGQSRVPCEHSNQYQLSSIMVLAIITFEWIERKLSALDWAARHRFRRPLSMRSSHGNGPSPSPPRPHSRNTCNCPSLRAAPRGLARGPPQVRTPPAAALGSDRPRTAGDPWPSDASPPPLAGQPSCPARTCREAGSGRAGAEAGRSHRGRGPLAAPLRELGLGLGLRW